MDRRVISSAAVALALLIGFWLWKSSRRKDESLNAKATLIGSIIQGENGKLLDFYGKVIDQDGAPVTGVKIHAGIGTAVSFTKSGGHFVDAETDSDGSFHFQGIHGAGMGPFILLKDGYSFDQASPESSRPSNYIPDPKQPVIFHVWKQKGAEPMVHVKVRAFVLCDGTPQSYDLLSGKANPAGDLVITLTRNPVQIQNGSPFDWNATIEIRNGGGLVPINETYPNVAPATGYIPKVTLISVSESIKPWIDSFRGGYYFMSENRKIYGRVSVRIQADYQPPPTFFELDIISNPAGSRNLEYTPSN